MLDVQDHQHSQIAHSTGDIAGSVSSGDNDWSNEPSVPALDVCSGCECQDRISDLNRDNIYLWQQLRTEQEENAKLKTQLMGTENAKAMLDQQSLKLVYDELERSQRELELWRVKATDKEALGYFTKNANKQQSSDDVKDFKKDMDRMHFKLEGMMYALSDRVVKVEQLLNVADPTLQTLCHRVFGTQEFRPTIVGCSYLIRSLVSAAVCEWVFERNLQEMCIANSLLMDTMLSQLAMLGKSP